MVRRRPASRSSVEFISTMCHPAVRATGCLMIGSKSRFRSEDERSYPIPAGSLVWGARAFVTHFGLGACGRGCRRWDKLELPPLSWRAEAQAKESRAMESKRGPTTWLLFAILFHCSSLIPRKSFAKCWLKNISRPLFRDFILRCDTCF